MAPQTPLQGSCTVHTKLGDNFHLFALGGNINSNTWALCYGPLHASFTCLKPEVFCSHGLATPSKIAAAAAAAAAAAVG